MTEAQTLRQAMDSYFASSAQVEELQKAITTADGSAGDLQPIEYDAEILSMLVKKAPFMARLRAINQVTPARSSIVAYRRKETGGATSFIGETDNIPGTTDSTWQAYTALMKTIVTPIEISDLAQLGAQDVTDIYAQEIADGMIDHAYMAGRQIIQGTAGANAWDGLTNIITTNTTNMNAQTVSRTDLRTACNTILRAGGTPTAILTTPEVSAELEDELYPGIRDVNVTELVTGINVTAFRAPNGQDIPIVVDYSVPNNANQRELYVLDETVLQNRVLMNPTTIPLAKTKLSTSTVLASFQTFYCRAQTWQARLYNIA
jgi:hypothetical protein